MVGDGVEILAADEDMKTLNKRVVKQEHDAGKPPRPLLTPKEVLTNVTNVAHLWVLETKLPKHQAGVEGR